jgi:hypothetical protein
MKSYIVYQIAFQNEIGPFSTEKKAITAAKKLKCECSIRVIEFGKAPKHFFYVTPGKSSF